MAAVALFGLCTCKKKLLPICSLNSFLLGICSNDVLLLQKPSFISTKLPSHYFCKCFLGVFCFVSLAF